MKTILLVASTVCAFIAAILAGHWGWLGIDPNPRLVHVWGYFGLVWFAAAFLPWGRPFRRWFE